MKYLVVTLAAVTVLFTACSTENINEPVQQNNNSAERISLSKTNSTITLSGDNGPLAFPNVNFYGTPQVYDLFAGQYFDAGSVTIVNNDANLYVTYKTNYQFGTLHLWAGTDLSLLPVNNSGNPVNGQFPYQAAANGANEYTFSIPLSDIPLLNGRTDIPVYIVAHAEITGDVNNDGLVTNETAFGGTDLGISGNRWWYYMTYSIQVGSTSPIVNGTLETAFAKGGWVFTTDRKSNPESLPSLQLTKNKWGWAINIKADGTYNYDIFAGAGLNNTSRAKLVGKLTVTKSGTTVIVSYNLNGYSMPEAHIYAGDFKPTTLAPGQYGNTYYFGSESTGYASTHTSTFEITDTNGDGIWIIAHAVVYGQF